MPTFDSAWDAITSTTQLTVSRWNDVLGDLETWLDGGIDDTFIAAGALSPDRINGTALTLTGAGTQTATANLTFTGDFTIGGEFLRTAVTEDGSDLTPSVNGVNVLYIDNTQGAAKTFTAFDDPVEGQELKVYAFGGDDVKLQGVAADGTELLGEIINAQAAADLDYTAAADVCLVAFYRATDLNGDLNAVVWVLEDNKLVT
jgi:hypothetical protein